MWHIFFVLCRKKLWLCRGADVSKLFGSTPPHPATCPVMASLSIEILKFFAGNPSTGPHPKGNSKQAFRPQTASNFYITCSIKTLSKGCYCNFFQTSYFCKHTCKDTLKLPFQIYIYNVFFQELELPGMLRYHTIRFSLLSHGNLTFIKHLLLKQHSSTGTIHQTRNIKKCDWNSSNLS